MSSRSIGREIAFLVLGQISNKAELNTSQMVYSLTQALRKMGKNQLEYNAKDLESIGAKLYTYTKLDQKTKEYNEEIDIDIALESLGLTDIIKELGIIQITKDKNLDNILNDPNKEEIINKIGRNEFINKMGIDNIDLLIKKAGIINLLNKAHIEDLIVVAEKLEKANEHIYNAIELTELVNEKEEAYDFAIQLVDNYRKNKDLINETIKEAIDKRAEADKKKGWETSRIFSNDRLLLKLAISEYLKKETPSVVIMDEILNIANRYSTQESAKFINGVLSDIFRSL